jgi:signal transduction histidine kinase
MVSHDLRTPLSSVILATEHMTDGLAGPISDSQRELLDVIQRKLEPAFRGL